MSLAPQFCVGAFLVSAMASVPEAPGSPGAAEESLLRGGVAEAPGSRGGSPAEAAAPEKWEALAAYQRRLAAGTAAGGEGLAAFPEPTAATAAPFAAADDAADDAAVGERAACPPA